MTESQMYWLTTRGFRVDKVDAEEKTLLMLHDSGSVVRIHSDDEWYANIKGSNFCFSAHGYGFMALRAMLPPSF